MDSADGKERIVLRIQPKGVRLFRELALEAAENKRSLFVVHLDGVVRIWFASRAVQVCTGSSWIGVVNETD